MFFPPRGTPSDKKIISAIFAGSVIREGFGKLRGGPTYAGNHEWRLVWILTGYHTT
jgi:hypothetical protein